ncbi:alpha-parvin isoform X3 [Pelodiscus sinensis]|uniref:alpha-parvin isoform X3 n=1 Tax=Pelodiscus sinensis TaxID=13735 RepID=UPI003F6D1139
MGCGALCPKVSELQEEGINAINLPLSPIPFELDPEDTMLEENEVRTMIDPNSRSDPKLQELMKVLIDWINDVLAGERIIVKDLAEDMYDGQVLQKLFEKLECEKLNVAEVTQSEIAQKQKLQTVLEKINETLKLPPRSIKWNVDTVHAKSLVAILRLLVALSQYFRAPIRLPDHVSIQVVVVQKREGILQSRQIQEEITGNTEALSGRHERDAFDTLFDHAPDKLNVVKKTLITFVNKHLNKLNLEVTELETQFADGVYLVLLMGLLEGYFVPLHSFFLTPDSFEQKVVNVSFSFELMQDGGLEKPKPRPEAAPVACAGRTTPPGKYSTPTASAGPPPCDRGTENSTCRPCKPRPGSWSSGLRMTGNSSRSCLPRVVPSVTICSPGAEHAAHGQSCAFCPPQLLFLLPLLSPFPPLLLNLHTLHLNLCTLLPIPPGMPRPPPQRCWEAVGPVRPPRLSAELPLPLASPFQLPPPSFPPPPPTVFPPLSRHSSQSPQSFIPPTPVLLNKQSLYF